MFDHIEPTKWYSVCETAQLLSYEVDTVRRRIGDGKLQAFIMPGRSGRGHKRIFQSTRIQGAEIIRFIKANLTELRPVRSVRPIRADRPRMLVG